MARHGINPDTRNVHKGMTDIMIDIETTGRNALENSMVQIAGKKFNISTGEIGEDMFVANLGRLKGRVDDPDTMNWWGRQDKAIREGVFENPLEASVVMNAFADWCYPQNTLRFWGKPTHFDFVFVQSYFDTLKIPNPFHYRMARDMNSYIAALYESRGVKRPPDSEVPYKDVGGAHNALSDVINQISELFAHVEHSKTV